MHVPIKTYAVEFSKCVYKYKITFSLTSHFDSDNIFYNKARVIELLPLNNVEEYLCMKVTDM